MFEPGLSPWEQPLPSGGLRLSASLPELATKKKTRTTVSGTDGNDGTTASHSQSQSHSQSHSTPGAVMEASMGEFYKAYGMSQEGGGTNRKGRGWTEERARRC